WLRVVDSDGNAVVDRLNPEQYGTIIDEAITPYSYLKSPYYKALGYPDGIYRVGPLARLHVATRSGTPRADRALATFRQVDRRGSFYYHHARLSEILYAVEMIEHLHQEPAILHTHS